jgi:hypothetical protein
LKGGEYCKEETIMTSHLQFSVSDGGVFLTGKTFDVKDILKAKGAVWNPNKVAWFFADTDVDRLRASLEADVEACMAARKSEKKQELAAKRAHRKWLTTPEGQAHLAAEEKERVRWALGQKALGNYTYLWICCEECEVVDWKRQNTYCLAHAEGGNAFRVRGGIYTGD